MYVCTHTHTHRPRTDMVLLVLVLVLPHSIACYEACRVADESTQQQGVRGGRDGREGPGVQVGCVTRPRGQRGQPRGMS